MEVIYFLLRSHVAVVVTCASDREYLFECCLCIVRCIFCHILLVTTLSQKNKTPNSCPQLHQILTDFKTVFTGRLSSKFATKVCLNIPPRLKHVATLPCEI